MSNLQKWLGIGAIIFVVFYLGAAVITIQSRIVSKEQPTKIEAARAIEAERHLLLPELFLPMGILLTLAGSYLIVRRRNARKYQRLDDKVDEMLEPKPSVPSHAD
jgi:uncharacterized membrane protein